MNHVALIGRLTADPTVTMSGETSIAKYTLAVDGYKKDDTNFIRCVAFKSNADFAEKYLKKGTKIAVEGSIKTGSYDDKDGKKVYTTDVIVNRHEFCESKSSGSEKTTDDGFMTIPDGLGDEGLPF